MEAGERINGRYKIIKIIGSGGMAKVYLARDLILERDVAVKLMAYDFHNDENSIRRFKREALSTTELVHPSIVNIFDVGEDENPYIVMEYVEGMDLKEHIHDHHPIPYKKSLAIMNQVLEAVEYAHANGIIHRDLKPQNILIDNEGKVKITDFGIAIALSQNSITQTNSLLGSVHYLSPEQARGSLVTKQSDIYSLGILLYEILTGDVPFDGESAVSIALKHFQNPLPSLRQIDNRIPQPLENVVLKATAKEANQRYESVSEMKEDLRTSLSPERSGEPRFEPRDPNEEDTRVLEPITVPVKSATDLSEDNAPSMTEENIEDDQGNKKKPKKKRRWLWILIPLLLLIAGVAIALFLSRPQEVQVPSFEDMTQEEAEDVLAEYNLLLGEIIERYSEEVDEGIVIDSDPSSGATVREETEVDLIVSTGIEPFEIQNYEDQVYEEIRAELTQLGFEVVSEDESSEEIAAGNIISQDISPGEEVIPTETTITFTVSRGEEGFLFRDLTTYTRQGVDDYIEAENRQLNMTVEEQFSNDIDAGQVISQQPEAGTRLFRGSNITVVFSLGPEEPEEPEEPQLISFSRQVTIPYQAAEGESEEDPDEAGNDEEEDPAAEPIPNLIQIFIEDAENDMSEPVHDFEMTADTQLFLNFTVEEGQEATYRIERDGEVIEEETVGP